ncbi:MAG TPA: NAD(P)/FAD-dependent oxidoreductase, partial [Treponemataceae bacterium]|nr:NAD(P)/FAD-dependent oxidoreductase [Treponemataceae bacterium]
FINGVSNGVSVSTTSNADSQLLSLCSSSPKKTVKNILCSLGLSESLVLVLFHRVALDTSLVASLLDRKSRKALSLLLEDFRFTINRLGGFDEAMATAGGVDTTEVQGKTMESRIVSGLHFAGEVLDVDGDTGGYNLQFAFSSAALAADHIIKNAMPSSL